MENIAASAREGFFLLGIYQGVLSSQLGVLLLRCFKGDVTGQLDHMGS